MNGPNCEICILAGGLSRRMGRDKSRLRLGGRTVLNQIRTQALATGLAVRVIRRDAVPRCGPLGGIYTALQTTRAEAVLFLACDMPLITAPLIQHFLQGGGTAGIGSKTRFNSQGGVVGFPCLLSRAALPMVAAQIEKRRFSLQELAGSLNPKLVRLPRRFSPLLLNVNTPGDWARARRLWNDQKQEPT